MSQPAFPSISRSLMDALLTIPKELWKFKFQSIAGQPQEIIEVSMPDCLLQVASGRSTDTEERPRMQKVPRLLRWENGDHQYDPMVVSLGPYHHGKPQYQLAEKFKLKELEMFVEGSGNDVQFFYSKVLELVTFCRGCYFHDSTSKYDDRTFAGMMLLDSCFIINVIFLASRYGKNFVRTYQNLGELYLYNVVRDLFLLENQIPFRLLKLMIRLRHSDEYGDLKILYSFLFRGKNIEYKRKEVADRDDDDRPFHILDGRWLGDTSELHGKENKSCYEQGWLKHIRNTISRYVYSCIPRFFRRKTDPMVEFLFMERTYTFRSATDLKANGIYCKPSSFLSRRSINFKSNYFFATLEVPVRNVNINTKSCLMNMIAYELVSIHDPKIMDRPMTAYVNFMKSLIDSPIDVKELRERKILFTNLGTDEDVVNFFNEIKTYHLGRRFMSHENVKKAIESHYNSKAKTWLAELLHTYFKSPWSAIALLAAVILLILTLIQTYYTALPCNGRNKK